jgi:hypothetical protein
MEISVAPSPGSQFARKHANQGESHPLAEAKRLQKLLLGVLERRIYGVDSGYRQVYTSVPKIGLSRKYSEAKKRAMSRVY